MKKLNSTTIKKVLKVDIMKDGGKYFYKTITYRFTPPLDFEAFYAYIVNTLPSLVDKNFTFAFTEEINGKKQPVWGEFVKNNLKQGKRL